MFEIFSDRFFFTLSKIYLDSRPIFGQLASIVDELVFYGPDLEVLDDGKAARSIVVDNMPEEAREEDIIIHFQKRKHGGGDIDNVRIIENTDTVVVTFDSDEGWWFECI